MKYLKKFNEEGRVRSIEEWCDEILNISKYTIVEDNIVNVNDSVKLGHNKLSKIPIQFGKVKGSFVCNDNLLTSLKGCPIEISGGFYCYSNRLTTLKFSPKIINGDYVCCYNRLTSLKGCTDKKIENFDCQDNRLTNLVGGPKKIIGNYNCTRNDLISLEGIPEEVTYFNCLGNPVAEICLLFRNHKDYLYSLDYNYLRGTNIVKHRFQEACEEAGIKTPKFIKGYKYI